MLSPSRLRLKCSRKRGSLRLSRETFMFAKVTQSIRAKFALAFGVLMVMSIATGAFSILKLNEVSAIGRKLEGEIAAVSTLGDLARTSQTLSTLSFHEHYAAGDQHAAFSNESSAARSD